MYLPKCYVIVLNWNGKEHIGECFGLRFQGDGI